MTQELRERVAEEMWQADMVRAMGHRRSVPWAEAGPAAHRQWLSVADAAIALVLEEAAKVADETGSGSYDAIHIAAAIRALKEGK